ncbi:uncharacterized protein LOC141628739 [Silene latifolia]|uniref:uncharacterized protein LOC141628739 n=1 Tax=Silene latifolia TaxID=37657 RepID=UPI003D78763E
MDYKPPCASSWAWRKVCEVKEIFKAAYGQGKWTDADEDYSINVGYIWLTQHNLDKVTWFKSVWNKFIIPKHSFILRLLNHERLLTLDSLVKIGITHQTNCFLCGIHAETHTHLFQECVFVNRCYTKLLEWLQLQVSGQITATKMLKMRNYTGFIRLLMSSLIADVQYKVWTCRNVCKIEGYVTHPVTIINRVKADCRMWIMNVHVGRLKREEIEWCTRRDLM